MLVSPAIFWTLIFLILFWQMLLPMILGNLILFVADVIAMLLCFLVDGDVITTRLMLWPVCFVCIGRCYCQFCFVTDGVATFLVLVVPNGVPLL